MSTFAINGAIVGLVAITAPCAIGFVGGILVVLSVDFFDRALKKTNNFVGAIASHGVPGA